LLNIETTGVCDAELERLVAARCSEFGWVQQVKLYRARPGAPARSFALVSMDTREASEKLAAAFGRSALGYAVVIFLEEAAGAAGGHRHHAAAAAHGITAIG
jgi:hypothetical protein